ncbi:YeiH family protein [Flavihumibacter solisilvae]|uniref:PSE family sulfate exporter n=1 Tax=Flavihumibacter solisilvae TaxID=1349421 RepID=A0A0C1L536_9BACT|nr:putative sulfate exporter family transporter [Flavihumibacter solisilvae]KIC90738.1 PSE family sulfate exporter [Flavihumibacter solisilvae]
MAAENKMPLVTEDWTAVILGFLIIFVTVAGLHIVFPAFSWSDSSVLAGKIFSGDNLTNILLLLAGIMIVAALGALLLKRSLKAFLLTFPVVFLISMIALLFAGNSQVRSLNLEAVIFSLALGLLISNLFRLPDWFRQALSTELYVKIGLVLLGTSVIFSDILKAGSFGLLQALIVVVSVWYFAYWVCKKLKVDEELRIMIASAVSICGVSAAIATAGAIKGDTKKLSYVISLVLVTAIPMMIGMPYLAKLMHLPEAVTGAWLGGSIDTTGAVVASGTLVGEEALKISTIVKFAQNVLLGIAAFAISVYWTYTNNQEALGQNGKPTLGVIWERFPKFVIGFLAASLLFSFGLEKQTIDLVKEPLKHVQTLWFVLAFTSIGLETRFADLFHHDNRKPLYGFLIAQGFNIIVTLIVAAVLFR